MPITDYQAKYLAYELTKRCPSESVEKLANAVAGAQAGLNPHQVNAALFAFQLHLSKRSILAGEVRLGKVIEADWSFPRNGRNGSAGFSSSRLRTSETMAPAASGLLGAILTGNQ